MLDVQKTGESGHDILPLYYFQEQRLCPVACRGGLGKQYAQIQGTMPDFMIDTGHRGAQSPPYNLAIGLPGSNTKSQNVGSFCPMDAS